MSDSSGARTPPKRSPTKTILLWLFLSGVFLALYAYHSGDGLMAWRIWKTLLSGLVVVLTCVALFIQFRRSVQLQLLRGRYWEEQTLEASRLEDEGRLEEAARQWEGLVNRPPHGSAAWAEFTLRQAWVLLRMGRGQEFSQLLEPVLSHEDAQVRELAHCLLALRLALRGHLPRAESHLEGLKDEGIARGVVGGLATQVLLARQGRFEDALAFAVPPWDIADPHCRYHRQLWALLRAFTLEHLPPTPERERDARRTREELRGPRPGELDSFTEQWPELRAFLEQRLAAGETSPAPESPTAVPTGPGPNAFTRASFGLGLPARWDPLFPPRASWRGALLLATLGGFVALVLMDGTRMGLELCLLGGLLFASILGLFWLPSRQENRSLDVNLRAMQALGELRMDDAVRILDGLLDSLRGGFVAAHRPTLLFNRATLFARMGERALARRIFHSVAHLGARELAPPLRAFAWESLAECDALDGHFERARTSMELAESLTRGRATPQWYMNLQLLALHEGDVEGVAEQAASIMGIPKATQHQRCRAKLLHAYALGRLEHPTAEQREERERLQEELRQQARPGEFDYLTAGWPELRAFLVSLGEQRAAA